MMHRVDQIQLLLIDLNGRLLETRFLLLKIDSKYRNPNTSSNATNYNKIDEVDRKRTEKELKDEQKHECEIALSNLGEIFVL